MSDVYVARWSVEQAGKLVITDHAGNEVDTFAIPPGVERPSEGFFLGALWAPIPGAEWEEDRPGRWTHAVFRES